MTATHAIRQSAVSLSSLPNHAGTLVVAQGRHSLMDLEPDYMLGLLARHGCVILRGFSADRGSFERFTQQFAADFVLPMMRVARPKVEGDADAKTAHVDVGSHAMGLHQELSFTPIRPDAIWLLCEKVAGHGGETTIADGVRIYEAMTAALRQIFMTKRLKFRFGSTLDGVAELFHVAPEQLHATLARHAPALTYTQNGNALSFTYLTPAFQKTKFGNATAFANFLLFSQTSAACGHPEAPRVMGMLRFEDDTPIPAGLVAELQAIAEPLVYPIPWEAGDLAFIDNTRMMHGRRGFEAQSDRTVYYRAARSLIAI